MQKRSGVRRSSRNMVPIVMDIACIHGIGVNDTLPDAGIVESFYQESEYSFCGADESFYTDIFPVKSTEEAEFLNQEYDGFSLESEFKRKALFLTNGKPSWH